jgi:hypothetical protein
MKPTKKKLEIASDGFKFEVGAMYENMKGTYKVISIHNELMLIRWDDGSEVSTSIDLQKRIIDRIANERKLQQQEVKEQDNAPQKAKRSRIPNKIPT